MSAEALSVTVEGGKTETVSFEGKEELVAKITKVVIEGEVKGETKLVLIRKEGEEDKETEVAVLNEEHKEAEIEQTFCGKCDARLRADGESTLLVTGEYVAQEEKKEEEAPAEEEKKEEEAPAKEEKKEEEAPAE